ncbi:ComF family protein [Candidatus Peregrinibacteria bacterium]|nr:ComF family protein [Candidatus Peregrinibacteria bacterium]
MRFVSALWELFLNALFPPVCASCKSEGDFLCARCLGSLAKRRIGRYSPRARAPEFASLAGVVYALDYAKNPQIRAAIQQFKYKFTEALAQPFAKLIAEKVGELGMVKGRRLILVPVPLHAKRLRERGFNQAEVIAHAIQTQWPHGLCEVQNLLVRPKETSQQAKLGRSERHQNLKDAFILNKKIVHKTASQNLYFVVDDVCTTGSTLDSCAKALREGGINPVYGLVIARSMARSK